MALLAVAADSSRYDAMDTTTDITGIGGGAGAGVETDIAYQNAISISRKVTAHGFFSSTGLARDITAAGRKTWLAKLWLTNYGSLTIGANKMEARIGSGTAAYHAYVLGSAAVDYPSVGGWVIVAIDPSVAVHRSSTTGSPVLTACDYFAAYADCTTSKESNLAMDAIDVHYGHYITGGTSTDPDGTFADILADDEGDSTNGRIGAVTSDGDTISAHGRLIVGATSASATLTSVATEFTSVGETVKFPDNWAAAGFSGLIVDLGIAGTTVTWTRVSFASEGTEAGEDTRAVLDVVNTTSTLGLIADLCSFKAFASLNLNTKSFLTDCTFTECGQIDTGGTGTDPGADLSRSSVVNSTAASAVLWDTNHDPTTELADMSFISSGTGHAIELGTNCPSTVEFARHDYGSAYAAIDGSTGNEVLYNNSGKAITVNVTDGSTPTVRNGAGASTTVNNTVPVSVTVLDDTTGLAIATTARVYIERVSDGLEIINSAVDGSGIASGTYDYAGDAAIVGWVREMSLTGTDYHPKDFSGTIESSGFSLTVRLTPLS